MKQESLEEVLLSSPGAGRNNEESKLRSQRLKCSCETEIPLGIPFFNTWSRVHRRGAQVTFEKAKNFFWNRNSSRKFYFHHLDQESKLRSQRLKCSCETEIPRGISFFNTWSTENRNSSKMKFYFHHLE